ncbi:MAG TPA: thioredoxin family protein [Planctomycetota bacterium]|nr:thioredoxin family protein [Planctomycetota bacterium]
MPAINRLHALVVSLLLSAPTLAADPPFVDLDYDTAVAKARYAGKLLLLDFTATSSPPCQMMEKQTWADEKVRAWVAEHAVAIQVDIDKHQDVARSFGIKDVPTVVFQRNGMDLERHAGFRSATELVAWGDDVLAGKRETRHFRVDTLGLLHSDDVDKRYEAAGEALGQRDYDVALHHYVWLWPNTRGIPRYAGVRTSSMLFDMAALAKVYEPARVEFRHIVDQVQVKVEEHDVPAFLDWMEWSGLCRAFDARARMVTWYEETRDKQGHLVGGDPAAMPQGLILSDVFAVLVEAGRPVDAVRLYADVRTASKQKVLEFQKVRAIAMAHPGDFADQMRERGDRKLRDDLAALYAAALADGQTEQAASVAADLLGVLDDTDSRLTLVKQAVALSEARPAQLGAWLDEAAAQGAEVAVLRALLAQPAAADAQN